MQRKGSIRTPRNNERERLFRIHLNNQYSEDIPMQQKELLKDVFKKLELKTGAKFEQSAYTLRTADQETVSLSVTIKNLSHFDEFWLYPPYVMVATNLVSEGRTSQAKKDETPKLAFGVSLRRMKRSKETGLPYVLQKCFDYLSKERSLRTIGLFRLSGNKKEIFKLKQRFDEHAAGDEQEVEFPNTTDPNIVTGVVKAFFAELPEPLLDNYAKFAEIGALTEEQIRITKLKTAVEELPSAHRDVLRYLIEFLVKLIMYTHKNKITVFNMSIVFGPLLLRSNNAQQEVQQEQEGTRGHTLGDKIKSIYIGTIATMIDNYLQIFGLDQSIEGEDGDTKATEGAPAVNTIQDLLSKIATPPTEVKVSEKSPRDVANNNNLSKLSNMLNFNKADEPQMPNTSKRSGTDSEHWNEMQTSWMKFVEEWKRKYRDEVDARRTEQSKYEVEKLELHKKIDELKAQLNEKDQFISEQNLKLQNADHNLIMEKQQLQLDLEEKTVEIRDLKRRYEEEVRELKRQHLLSMKNTGEGGTTVNYSDRITKMFDERKSMAYRNEPAPKSSIEEPSEKPYSVSSPRKESVITSQSSPRKESVIASQPSPRKESVIASQLSPRKESVITSQSLPRKESVIASQPSQRKPSIANSQPIEVQENPNAPKHICAKCSREIHEEWIEAVGGEYHKTCFVCSNCSNPIAGPFANRSGNFWCKTCLEDQANKGKTRIINPVEQNKQAILEGIACASCGNSIEKGSTDKVKALGKVYHKSCFHCQKCGTEFVNNKFYNLDNDPVCASCKRKVKA